MAIPRFELVGGVIREGHELVTKGPFGFVLAHRVRIEERALERAFPIAYPAYRARTKRLLPFVY